MTCHVQRLGTEWETPCPGHWRNGSGRGRASPTPRHPDAFDVGSIAEEFVPPDDDRSHINDWLMVRDIRRRLVEGT